MTGEEFLVLLVGGGAVSGLMAVFTTWQQGRTERAKAQAANDVQLETHRDEFVLDLLKAARAEVAELRAEVVRSRGFERHLMNFDEALRHIEALLEPGDPAQRALAERQARAFVKRIKAMTKSDDADHEKTE